MEKSSDLNVKRNIKRSILLVLSILLISCLVFFVSYYDHDWPEWTGFGKHIERIHSNSGEIIEYRSSKTLWDLLDLLIVPFILAIGAYWLQQSGKKREQFRQEQQSQDTTLQGYLDKITDLLIKAPSNDPQTQELKSVMIHSRTMSALRSLNDLRKGFILTFLYDSNLIIRNKPEIVLKGANFNDINLKEFNLTNADLSRITLQHANLSKADLSQSDLSNTDLKYANLSNAVLHGVILHSALLNNAILSNAEFHSCKITEEERKLLSPERQIQIGINNLMAVTSGVGTIYKRLNDNLNTIQFSTIKSNIKSMQDQLNFIKERKGAWIKEGKDILTDKIRKEIIENAPQGGYLAEAIRQKNEWERENSDFCKDLDNQHDELLDLLEKEKQNFGELVWADLSYAKFTHANLNGVNLRRAKCYKTDFENSNLRKAWLIHADLTGAILKGADLRGAVLINAILTGTILTGADLTGAQLSGAIITEEQLKSVKSVKDAWRNGKRL